MKRKSSKSLNKGSDFVKAELLDLVNNIPKDHQCIGELNDDQLIMPLKHNDGRKVTWTKKVTNIAESICNNPKSRDDCWFIPSNTDDGRHTMKLSKDGSKNKWQTHRFLYFLLNTDNETYNWINDRKSEPHGAHICKKGQAKVKGEPCCINPYHIKLVSGKENQDDKGCNYGCAKLCPHDPKCIFTWGDSGLGKECFNDPNSYPPNECPHERTCSHSFDYHQEEDENNIENNQDD
jgi:hypothetical protein